MSIDRVNYTEIIPRELYFARIHPAAIDKEKYDFHDCGYSFSNPSYFGEFSPFSISQIYDFCRSLDQKRQKFLAQLYTKNSQSSITKPI